MPDARLSQHEWLAQTRWALLTLGIALLGAALVFFFAYNWQDMHRYSKLGLAAGSLIACSVWALLCTPASRPWQSALFGASLCCGALFALIGQIYQTGADPWQLFFAWGLLITPFVVVARSALCWLLWLVVLNLAALRYAYVSQFSFLNGSGQMLLPLLLNLAVLLAFEILPARRLQVRPSRHIARVCACAVIALLSLTGAYGWWEEEWRPYTLAFWPAMALCAWYYWPTRRNDLFVLAICLYAVIQMLVIGLSRVSDYGSEVLEHLLLSLTWLALSAYAGVWLVRQARRPKAPDESPAAPSDNAVHAHHDHTPGGSTPWWLAALQLVAAWIGAFMIAGTIFATLSLFGFKFSAPGLGACGTVFCILALMLLRSAQLFVQQCGLAFSLAGQGLVSAAVVSINTLSMNEMVWGGCGALLAAVMFLPVRDFKHRCLCALLGTGYACAALLKMPALLALAVSLYAALACYYWLGVRDGIQQRSNAFAALAWAASLATLSAPAVLPLIVGALQGKDHLSSPLAIGLSVVALYAIFCLAREANRQLQFIIACATVLLLLFSQPAPGVIAASVIALTSLAARRYWLYGVALCAAAGYVAAYYYQLHISLADKALWLGASGVTVLIFRHVLLRTLAREAQT